MEKSNHPSHIFTFIKPYIKTNGKIVIEKLMKKLMRATKHPNWHMVDRLYFILYTKYRI